MSISVDETPIAADCDCSDSYFDAVMASPTLGRMDRYDAKGKEDKSFPAVERVAARGFIPFAAVPGAESTDQNEVFPRALNFQFTVLTTLFYNYIPPEGWTFETQDEFPIG